MNWNLINNSPVWTLTVLIMYYHCAIRDRDNLEFNYFKTFNSIANPRRYVECKYKNINATQNQVPKILIIFEFSLIATVITQH